MNRTELARRLASHAGLPADVARSALDALFGGRDEAGLIALALRGGERVQLAGFGTFAVRQRPARSGLHPRTGERLRIPAGVTPAFRPGAALRAALRPAQGAEGTAGGCLARADEPV